MLEHWAAATTKYEQHLFSKDVSNSLILIEIWGVKYDVTFTHKKIGKAFLVSKETLEDDLFKVIAAKPKALARGIARKIEYDCADIFNNISSTTNNTGADGVALSDASHPREDGFNQPSIKLLNSVKTPLGQRRA